MDVWADQAKTITAGRGTFDIILGVEHKRDGKDAKAWMNPQTAREVAKRLNELADECDENWRQGAAETRR